MEPNEIIAGNMLIAEFMGAMVLGEDNSWYNNVPEYSHRIHIESIEYHISWDWLMPVVEKIEALGYNFEIRRSTVEISEYAQEGRVLMLEHGSNKIGITYKMVIKFITWYNQNK